MHIWTVYSFLTRSNDVMPFSPLMKEFLTVFRLYVYSFNTKATFIMPEQFKCGLYMSRNAAVFGLKFLHMYQYRSFICCLSSLLFICTTFLSLMFDN
jgi:hypothetical protein